jgi:hypothetical protein
MPKKTFLRLVEGEQEVGGVFGPDDIAIMTSALDRILSDLKLVRRDDLATRMVAKLVIKLVRNGERDPDRVRQLGSLAMRAQLAPSPSSPTTGPRGGASKASVR